MEHSASTTLSPGLAAEQETFPAPQTTSQEKDADKEATFPSQPRIDEEKQIVWTAMRSQSFNSPIPVESEISEKTPVSPEKEADKEVTGSWQINSQEHSGAISMAHHESQQQPRDLINDIKGPPPSYDSLNASSSTSNAPLGSPFSIQPDDGSSLPPRSEDNTAVGQLLSWIPRVPRIPAAQMPPLVQPVIVPQLDIPPKGESVPFARCYSDALQSHDVSMQDFTAFLDGLAIAHAPNSALQGLKMLGVGVSSVPLPLIPLAGKGIKALASTGSGHSGSRMRLYMERARKEYFEPRGLRITILRDQDLNARLQLPTHASRLAPLTKNTLTYRLSERRLEGLAPYVCPLRFDLPEQDNQIKGVHKMARKHLESRFRRDAGRLAKLREKQWHDIMHASGDCGAWDQRYSTKMMELRKTQHDMIQIQNRTSGYAAKSAEQKEVLDALMRDQRELQIIVSERQMALQNIGGGRNNGVEAEIKEDNWAKGLKWIVIENS